MGSVKKNSRRRVSTKNIVKRSAHGARVLKKSVKSSQLTRADICAIIDHSAKASVRSLEVNGLRFEFGERALAKPSPATRTTTEPTTPTDAALSEEQHHKQNESSLEREELVIKEERLALMMIEDPYQAEQLIADGELEFAEVGDDGSESG